MSISATLRAAVRTALERGVTRYRIAKDAGLDHTGLTRFLTGARDLRLSNADRLAEALDLELPSKSAESKCKE